MKKHLLALAVTIIGSTLLLTGTSLRSTTRTIQVDGKPLILELANTPALREQGLSDRASLASDRGMLFVFPKADIYAFWMPRMHFPLDIIWIRNKKIVEIHENVPAPKGKELPITVEPKAKADRVLEINAGMVEEYHLEVGSEMPLLP